MKMKIQVLGGFCAALCSLLVLCPAEPTTTEPSIVDVEEDNVEYCDTCVKFDSTCYNRSYLFELNAPFRNHVVIKKMGILRENNVLYYSFEPILDDPETSKIAYVSLDNPNSSYVMTMIDRTFNFTVFDINQRDKNIYFGGSDGIWVLKDAHVIGSNLAFVNSKGVTINSIVSMDYVYFAKDNFKGIVKDKDGIFDILLDDKMIRDFVLDKDVEYTIVYLDSTGLHAYNSKTKEQVRLSTNPFFRGLTVDLDGVIYAWHVYGIYKVKLDNVLKHSKLILISDIEVGAMTFDNLNNIIYSKSKSLYKLTRTDPATTKC